MPTVVRDFMFSDSFDGQTCWQQEWTYQLRNMLYPEEIIPKYRDPDL
jgi:hypothetical protein